MRLIDADILENMGYELQRIYRQDANTMVYEVKKIADVPTVEAEPVRHARWISGKCSICGQYRPVKYVVLRGKTAWERDGQDNYCANCGAKMEEQE